MHSDHSDAKAFVCSFVRSFERSFDFPFVRFHFLALDIDANIARHSRKEVVNHIKKLPMQDPKVLKMVSQRGPGPPFWFPRGPGPPFWASWGPMWPHSAPRVEFWRISELIVGIILSEKSMKIGVDFRCGVGMLC